MKEFRPWQLLGAPARRPLATPWPFARSGRTAFPTEEEADLVDALRASDAWIDGLSIVAEDSEGTLVAHALLTRCHVDGVPALVLAPCAVLPRVQRTGAGSAVIRAALQAARAIGENLVLVLGHAHFYPRFGFIPASAFGVRASFDVPAFAWCALRAGDGVERTGCAA